MGKTIPFTLKTPIFVVPFRMDLLSTSFLKFRSNSRLFWEATFIFIFYPVIFLLFLIFVFFFFVLVFPIFLVSLFFTSILLLLFLVFLPVLILFFFFFLFLLFFLVLFVLSLKPINIRIFELREAARYCMRIMWKRYLLMRDTIFSTQETFMRCDRDPTQHFCTSNKKT